MKLRSITLSGQLGVRVAGNRQYLLRRAADMDRLLYPFEHREKWFPHRRNDWDGEYAGKWLDAAIEAVAVEDCDALRTQIRGCARRLLACATPDGYLGTHPVECRLAALFPLWTHWLAMKGLRRFAELEHDEEVWAVVERGGQWLLNTFGSEIRPGNAWLTTHAAMSCLDEMAALCRRTGDERFFRFGQSAYRLFDPFVQFRKNGRVPAMHAYSLLAYLGGAVEIAMAGGDREAIDWVGDAWRALAARYLFPTGSLSAHEKLLMIPSDIADGPLQETCATVEWMLLTQRLFAATGDSAYLHAMEVTIRNALLAAQSADGSRWTYFTPLRERKHWLRGPTDCCFYSGPRGVARIPRAVYLCNGENLLVNLFETGRADFQVGDQAVSLKQHSAYPGVGHVTLSLTTRHPVNFALQIRIPERTRGHSLSVNGSAVSQSVQAGGIVSLTRRWEDGDQIRLEFGLEVVTHVLADGSRMISRGVEVLALDRRDGPEFDRDHSVWADGADLESLAVTADGRRRYRLFPVESRADGLVLTPYADAGNGEHDDVPGAVGFKAAFLPQEWH